MTPEEMRTKFAELYETMAASGKTEYMRIFGQVEKEMMEWMIQNKPDLAQEWIEKLCAIRWRNYLTTKEAERIVAAMVPKAPWSREVWRQAMAELGLPIEEQPFYNKCALWAVMNMVYSDSSATIADIIGLPIEEIPKEQLVKAVHGLALDKLKDEDGRFNVRTYFGL